MQGNIAVLVQKYLTPISSFWFQESDVLIIPDREEENLENMENDNFDEDAGYPQSPDSDIPESTFSNPNRVREWKYTRHFNFYEAEFFRMHCNLFLSIFSRWNKDSK